MKIFKRIMAGIILATMLSPYAYALTNSAVNLAITIASDGFVLAGGTTSRILTVTGGNRTLGANSDTTGTGTYTYPAATDTLMGRASTDTLTNKTYDTAGTGNSFKINGTAISAIGGNTGTVATTTGTLTSTHCVKIDANGNFIDSGSICGGSATFVPIPTTVVTGTSQAATTNNAYISNNAGLCTITMPSSASVGDEVVIGGLGAGGWQLAQNASQLIHMGSAVTSTGTGGYLASTNQYDSVHLKCVVTNTTWVVIGSQGNITVN